MSYHFSTTIENLSFDQVIEKVTNSLKEAGFGVLTDIDIQSTLKTKLGVDFKKYRILGACNPELAHQALIEEDNIGLMLPCNVVVQEEEGNAILVSAIDPVASMQGVHNEDLDKVATQVRARLSNVIDSLK